MATKKIEHSALAIGRVIHLDEVRMPKIECPDCKGERVVLRKTAEGMKKASCFDCRGTGLVPKYRAKTRYWDKVSTTKGKESLLFAGNKFVQVAKELLLDNTVSGKRVRLSGQQFSMLSTSARRECEYSVMNAWIDLSKLAYWETSQGKLAYEVIGNELYLLAKAEAEWTREKFLLMGQDAPFTTDEEMQQAAVDKLLGGSKGRHMNNSLGVEAAIHEKEVRDVNRLVDRLERQYDRKFYDRVVKDENGVEKVIKGNPRQGTTREFDRKRREMLVRVDARESMLDDVERGMIPADQVDLYFYKKMQFIRELVFTYWKCKKMSSALLNLRQKKILRLFTGRYYVTMHLVHEANHLFQALEWLKSERIKNIKPIKEYSPEKAGHRHKESAAKAQTDAKANMTEEQKQAEFQEEVSTRGSAVVYQDDKSGSVDPAPDAEQQLIEIEEDPDMIDFDDTEF